MGKNVDKILKEIQEKLEAHPELREEIKELVNRIEEIFETNVEINIVANEDVDGYLEVFNEYSKENLEYDAMTLNQLIDYLNTEEGDLKVSIDPLYLKEGINEINNVILTTLGDKVVIVPLIKGNDDE